MDKVMRDLAIPNYRDKSSILAMSSMCVDCRVILGHKNLMQEFENKKIFFVLSTIDINTFFTLIKSACMKVIQ